MTRVLTLISIGCVLVAGILFASQSAADYTRPATVKAQAAAAQSAEVLVANKSCSTSSDCPNSKCSSGQCGACSTSSDCKYGKCSSGKCGACSTSSDCDGWGKCSGGQCGACSTSSDCGSFGSCSGGRCSKSPY